MGLRLPPCTFQPANKLHQRIDLFFVELVRESRHVAAHAATIRDRVEDALVADFSLPLDLGKVARVAKFTFRSLRLAVGAVTGDAIAAIHLRRWTHLAAGGILAVASL